MGVLCAKLLSRVRLFAASWTVACQAPLSMGFSRQEYWHGLSFPSPGDLPNPGMGPESLSSPALAGRFFTTSATWEVTSHYQNCLCNEDLCNIKKPFVSHFCGSPDTFIGLHF